MRIKFPSVKYLLIESDARALQAGGYEVEPVDNTNGITVYRVVKVPEDKEVLTLEEVHRIMDELGFTRLIRVTEGFRLD